MADPIVIPTFWVVIVTALVDSINPCAIGVLILLIATLLGLKNDKKKMMMVGSIYILSVFVTYLLTGLILREILFRISFISDLAVWINWIVGLLVIALGLLEIKDFFWYGKGITLAIPARRAKQIKAMMKKVSVPGAILLGIFVAAVELPCTGGPYLAITYILSQTGLTWEIFWLLFIYNIIFVLPLVVILLLVFFGVNVDAVKNWKQGTKKWMRLGIGLILVALGVVLIMFAMGSIHLGT